MRSSAAFDDAVKAEHRAPQELYENPRWYACYTRARHEKKVDRILRERGLESYLPTMPRERQWKDRKKIVDWPLFPSYVFARFTLGDMHRVLTTPGVATIVRHGPHPTPIAASELENVRRFVEALTDSGMEAEVRPLVEEGQRVRVVEGPFEGVEGIVLERRGRRRVLVGLEAIGQGLEVDMNSHVLEIRPPRG